jgi:hypothetical protein
MAHQGGLGGVGEVAGGGVGCQMILCCSIGWLLTGDDHAVARSLTCHLSVTRHTEGTSTHHGISLTFGQSTSTASAQSYTTR